MSFTDAERLDVKVFLDPATKSALEVKKLMPVFQRWIQETRLPGMLIDVADYTHVADGPGMTLIAHEGQYVLDSTEGRPGLLYSHRRGVAGGFDARLLEAVRRALRACALIEGEPALGGKLRFSAGDLLIRINDRLQAPNTPESFAALRPVLDAAARRIFDDAVVTLEARPHTAARALGVAVRAERAFRVSDVLARLDG